MVLKAKSRVRVFWGFPVDANGQNPWDGLQDVNSQKDRGVALMIAVMLIAAMLLLTTDLVLSSQVGLELTVKQRDNMKAEYLAKSGANVGIFLVTVDRGIDLMLKKHMNKSIVDSESEIWSKFNGIPVAGDNDLVLETLAESFALNRVNDSTILDQFREFEGQFVLDVSDEGGKINLSHFDRKWRVLSAMLGALFNCPAEKAFLDEKKIKPEELVAKIHDWIDVNDSVDSLSGLSGESDPYQRAEPPYGAKNAPLDSLEELRLIDGWDDEMHAVFSPYLTVFPWPDEAGEDVALNLNTVDPNLMKCVFPEIAEEECEQKFYDAIQGAADGERAGDKSKIREFLATNACYRGSGEPEPGAESGPGGPSGVDEARDRASWFGTVSRAFSVDVRGSSGNQERRLRIVIKRQSPDKEKNGGRAYEILFWRMI